MNELDERKLTIADLETEPRMSEQERVQKKAVDDLQWKVNELTALNRELEQWELRQETCSVDYSAEIESIEEQIQSLEKEIEEIENRYL